MAELFQTTKQNISLHLKNIFEEQELVEDAVVKDFLTTAADGKQYTTKHFNLDCIISIGYRVDSGVAEQRKNVRYERGVMLKSLRYGLTGKMDLLEIEVGDPPRYFPVEYKRGKPKVQD